MSETLPEPPDLDPAALAGTSFSRARRGFEPTEVHAALGRAADALRAWRLRDAQLLARIETLEERLSEAERLDESHLTAVLGEETARIVAAARDAATRIKANAEEESARLLEETSEEAARAAEALRSEAASLRDEAARLRDEAAADATRIRSEAETAATKIESDARTRHEELLSQAETVLEERTATAEQTAAEIVARAEAQLEAAKAEADQLRSESEAAAVEIREAAKEEGRSMVAEAKAVRERILRDLVERRATARRQIEAARAGQERIVEMLRSTISDVASTVDELDGVDQAANAAAAEAVTRVVVHTESEVAELLVELGEEPGQPAASTEEQDSADQSSADQGSADQDSTGQGSDAEEPTTPAAEEATQEEPTAEAPAEALESDEEMADEEAAAEEPVAETTSAEDHEDSGSDDEAAAQAEPPEEEGPGATVHDLFARIRAEGLGDTDESGDGDAEAGAPTEDEVEAPGRAVAANGTDDIDLTGDHAGATVAVLGGPGAGSPVGGGASAADEAAATDGAVATLQGTRELLDRRDELLGPVEKSLSRVLRRLASDEQNELLDQLRRHKRGRLDVQMFLPEDPADTVDRFAEALAPDFGRAAEAGAEFWAELTGTSVGSLFGDDDALRERLRAAVSSFIDLHRAHLERTFTDADAEGLEAPEVADRVRAAYRDWRSGSLADLAGDLAIAGFTHGERRAAGPGTPWRWVVDNGGLPCADGEDNALAGTIACEEPFPTGDVTPPAHPGCRCILAPAHQ